MRDRTRLATACATTKPNGDAIDVRSRRAFTMTRPDIAALSAAWCAATVSARTGAWRESVARRSIQRGVVASTWP
jgi:hypothetical protein